MILNKKEHLKEIQSYIFKNLKGCLINSQKIFRKMKNPKITIVISVYNGQPYIKSALLSIQNQNFDNIEIIIVDDFSLDNSVKLIKDLMKQDPRIILFQNNKHRGTLYTKTKGILNAKGKYIMTLDQDNLYTTENVFSILYKEAEKNNLDMLGFSSIYSNIHFIHKVKKYLNFFESPILFQPKIREVMFHVDNRGKIINRARPFIFLFFIKIYSSKLTS